MELQADSALTKRENQIAGLAACGLAKKEIADRLGTAYGTVNVLLDKAYKDGDQQIERTWCLVDK